ARSGPHRPRRDFLSAAPCLPPAFGTCTMTARLGGHDKRSPDMPVDAKYTTTATASGGGRDGKTALEDGTLSLDLVVPKELGGPGGDGANPEKLFALGYSACYLGALRVASKPAGVKVPDGSTVTATIGIGPRSEGGFGITAALD